MLNERYSVTAAHYSASHRSFWCASRSRTPAEVNLERFMRVHRIDTLLQWLFARLILPVVTLCLLSPTINLVQLSDTGSPAVLDELQYLHSLSSPGDMLQPIPDSLYCSLWEVRKAFVPFTMWLGALLCFACRLVWDWTVYNAPVR